MLEVPLYAQARTALETIGRAEIVGKLHLTTYAEVVATDMLANVVPKLRLGDEYSMGIS